MKRDIFAPVSKSWILFYPLQTKGMMGTSSCLGYPLVQPKVNVLGTSPASDPVVCRLIKCLQGVLWCSLFSGPSFCACTFFFDIIFWRCCLFLFPVHDLKGRVVALCRQRAPLMLALQPVMNSIPLYLFCAFFWLLPDVRNSAMTQNIMCAACAFYAPKRSLLVICRVIPRKKKKRFKDICFAWLNCSLITVMSEIWVVFSAGKWECVFNNLDRASAFEAWQTDFSAPSHSS